MDPIKGASVPHESKQHKRTTSSVLKFMMPRNHQRKPTATAMYCDGSPENDPHNIGPSYNSMLLPDHPHIRQHLTEHSGNGNQKATSPKKSIDMRRENNQPEKEDKPRRGIRSFTSSAENGSANSPKKKREKEAETPMKKSKSSTSLSALLSRPKSSKGIKYDVICHGKDKENWTPPGTADAAPPPIWAQFATQEPSNTTKVPLNDRKSIEDEMRRYTPEAYSPSKQRNFQDNQRPTLSGKSQPKPRPKSECLVPRPTRDSFAETVSGFRGFDGVKEQSSTTNTLHEPHYRANLNRQAISEDKSVGQRPSTEHKQASKETGGTNITMTKRGSRVMAAVAAFNGNTKELPREPVENTTIARLDPQAVETAFESLLDARNVPQITRDKMRSLDTKIKADFISKDSFVSGSASSTEGLSLQSSRPNTGKRSKTDDDSVGSTEGVVEAETTEESPKKARPRSRTFTFSKGDQSPSKKQKPERPNDHQRKKSGDLTPSVSSKSLTSSGVAQGLAFFSKASKPAVPEDYIEYLKRVQQPEKVEVGRIHKLRQLLRNETVGWVNDFITQGGMTELVGLLYRILKVEWRVEHEDSLLHETLLCLKALSTTSSAMHQLSDIQSTLFPTLLGTLFDKEKKGPSEFTTRGVIITLLSTYLTSSSSLDLVGRARLILSYLRDPSAPEEAQAPEFITSIYHPRPYRVWNKELDNIVKEVFWIFLHHVNIIPYPAISETCRSYVERHFPREHPPVPAAPYIGGVEWDATNYLTAHIDLLNGLIASLPTRDERNSLRQELKDSGFEKLMGVSLRTCKEKFYGCVHEALSTWVGAAMEDGWPYQDVRQGPRQEDRRVASPKKSPKKEAAPMLDMPKLDLGGGETTGLIDDGGWL